MWRSPIAVTRFKRGLGERIRLDAPRQCVAAGASREARALNLSCKHFGTQRKKNPDKSGFEAIIKIAI